MGRINRTPIPIVLYVVFFLPDFPNPAMADEFDVEEMLEAPYRKEVYLVFCLMMNVCLNMCYILQK